MYCFTRTSSIVGSRYNVFKRRLISQNPRCFCTLYNEKTRHLSIHSENRFYKTHLLNSDVKCKRSFIVPIQFRNFSFTKVLYDKEPLKPSSKVEATVEEIKKKKEELVQVPQKPVKKSLAERIKNELLHYYHGFRLLFVDIKISSGLVWRVLRGKSLSRREYRLLTRTVGDMFRLVPFSVFIIVPFMEFLLPFFIKFFPGMLPSTFQTASEKEDKLKKNFKVKLEMAKFLQQTLDEMAVQHKDHSSTQAKEFAEWFNKVRSAGSEVSTEEIMKYSKLFEDEITLDSLSRSQLVALCRVLEVQTLGTNYMLRFQLRMKLRSLAADDKMIQKEGVSSLTLSEVQQACRSRGMRAYGLSEERLRSQLEQWLDLSLNKKLPPSLLLLSRALMLPETIPTHDKLKATISILPETVVAQTQAAIGEKEGIIDHKVALEVTKQEEKKVREERKEQEEKKEKEELTDKAPVLSVKDTPELKDAAVKPVISKEEDQGIKAKDVEAIEQALENISKDKKKFVVEKEVIEDLKEEMADYQEDVQDLKKVVADEKKTDIKESKAAQRLFKKVDHMIKKLDTVLDDLESKEKQLKRDLNEISSDSEVTSKKKEELLRIDDILEAIRKIKNVPDNSKLEHIKSVLGKIDDDHDGSIKVEDVLKIIEYIGKENVHLSSKQIDELVELIEKEEILDVELKIEKALQKEKDSKKENKEKEKLKVKMEEDECKTTENLCETSKEGDTKEIKSQDINVTKKPKIVTPPHISGDSSKPNNNSKSI